MVHPQTMRLKCWTQFIMIASKMTMNLELDF